MACDRVEFDICEAFDAMLYVYLFNRAYVGIDEVPLVKHGWLV